MTEAERMILRNQNTIFSALQFLCCDAAGEPFRFITAAKLETHKFLRDHPVEKDKGDK